MNTSVFHRQEYMPNGCVLEMHRWKFLGWIFLITIIFIPQGSAFSQLLSPNQIMDSIAIPHSVRVGTNKVGNVFVFSGDATASYHYLWGELSFEQRYRGIGVRSSSVSFRDDEQSVLAFKYIITPDIAAVSRSLFILSNDTRNIGLANLQRLNSLLGISSQIAETFTMEMLGGVEQFRQLGTSATAPSFSTTGTLTPTSLDDYMISGDFRGNYIHFNSERTNADFDAQTFIIRPFEGDNTLQSTFRYRLLNRDFISPVGASATLATESRLEQRVSINGGFLYSLSNNWQSEVQWTLDNGAIDRSYRRPIVEISTTAVNRKLHEFQISLSASAAYRTTTTLQKFGLEYFSRTEENGIERRFPLDMQEEITLRQSENQRDNSSLRTRIFGLSEWFLSRKDSIRFNASLGILRYDTPSTQNNDDRDELSFLSEAMYRRQVSGIVAVMLTAQVQLQHIVFLKAQRSALNNWNRIIRLSPSLIISSHWVTMQPKFEVLANYTTYDFEGLSADVGSFSFRQVSYRDSISIALGANYFLRSIIFARYFERGQLSWNDFSETPLNKNYEQFLRVLFFIPSHNGLSVGCGGRYYALRQTSLLNSSPNSLSSEGLQQFFGPEISIELQFPSGSKCTLSGWYEEQYSNLKFNRSVPTLFFNAILAF